MHRPSCPGRMARSSWRAVLSRFRSQRVFRQVEQNLPPAVFHHVQEVIRIGEHYNLEHKRPPCNKKSMYYLAAFSVF